MYSGATVADVEQAGRTRVRGNAAHPQSR